MLAITTNSFSVRCDQGVQGICSWELEAQERLDYRQNVGVSSTRMDEFTPDGTRNIKISKIQQTAVIRMAPGE